jgi:hypothetical protein
MLARLGAKSPRFRLRCGCGRLQRDWRVSNPSQGIPAVGVLEVVVTVKVAIVGVTVISVAGTAYELASAAAKGAAAETGVIAGEGTVVARVVMPAAANGSAPGSSAAVA